MDFVNIGILAHVDAGKTSLTERLLFNAGVIDHIGRVDDGDTQTDSLAVERARGITVQSAVVSFPVDDLKVNVIDTPGHSDFVAEVERALRVLDGAILVISAVEGVQARTRVLMRSLIRLNIPTLIFVNKIDRVGARYAELISSISKTLTSSCVTMGLVTEIGTPTAKFTPFPPDHFRSDEQLEILTKHSESLLNAYVVGSVTADDCKAELARQTRDGLIYPTFFGSAITGEGVSDLVQGVSSLLPRSESRSEKLRATVFKIERGRAGEKIAYIRMYSGTINVRDRVSIYRRNHNGRVDELSGRVSAVGVFDNGTELNNSSATPGAIAKLWGLNEVQIGDQIGTSTGLIADHLFAPPTLETVIVPAAAGTATSGVPIAPVDPIAKAALFAALQRMAEQDPLIDVNRDEGLGSRESGSMESGSITVKLYGEVQKEVIASTLLEVFNIEVAFEESRTIYVEKPIGSGFAVQEFDLQGPNFFWATVGIRIEPGSPGSGVTYRLEVRNGSLPVSFHRVIEAAVSKTLRHGLYGWEVTDCVVTLTHTGYDSVITTGGHFHDLTTLMVAEALKQAKTSVFEPIHRFELQVPVDSIGSVMSVLNAMRAIPGEQIVEHEKCLIHGTIPASEVHVFTERFPELTHGEGLLLTEFDGYRPFMRTPLMSTPPMRKIPGANPYDRDQYMIHVLRAAL